MSENNLQLLAKKFADEISQQISASNEVCSLIRNNEYYEHKISASFITQKLNEFLKKEAPSIDRSEIIYDIEGDENRRTKQERGYPVLGTYSFPDSAILQPFRCAFEFDRETKPGSSRLKSVLMKASVHVLSGAYDSCVLVFVQKGDKTPYDYLGIDSHYTVPLMTSLHERGLYISFV